MKKQYKANDTCYDMYLIPTRSFEKDKISTDRYRYARVFRNNNATLNGQYNNNNSNNHLIL